MQGLQYRDACWWQVELESLVGWKRYATERNPDGWLLHGPVETCRAFAARLDNAGGLAMGLGGRVTGLVRRREPTLPLTAARPAVNPTVATARRDEVPKPLIDDVLRAHRIDRERVRGGSGFVSVIGLTPTERAALEMTGVSVREDQPLPAPIDHASLAYRARRGWRR